MSGRRAVIRTWDIGADKGCGGFRVEPGLMCIFYNQFNQPENCRMTDIIKYVKSWILTVGSQRILMNLKIGVIKGDGIGPEIVTEAMKVLNKTAEVFGHSCNYTQLLLGGASIDVNGVPLTDSSTTFLHNLEESSTFALSTLVTFLPRFMAISRQ